jgi:hypothetical protein
VRLTGAPVRVAPQVRILPVAPAAPSPSAAA